MTQKQQRNLNISFRQKDISILHELKRRSMLDYVSTSGLTIDLVRKGILYEQQQERIDQLENRIPLRKTN
jgi:hypothetical protein